MSLRDQLLKAGLVTEDQVNQAEAKGKKQRHQAKKNKKLGAEQARQKAAERTRREAEQAAKREQDRRLNAEREALRRRRENAARIRQIIKERRLNDPQAEIPYHFVAGKVVRKLRVTAEQQRGLACGRLGIVRNPHDEFDFPLLPRANVQTLAQIDPKLLLVLLDENAKPEEDGWDWPE